MAITPKGKGGERDATDWQSVDMGERRFIGVIVFFVVIHETFVAIGIRHAIHVFQSIAP